MGRLEEARTLYEETLEQVKARLTPEHPNTVLVMNNLAWLFATAQEWLTPLNPRSAAAGIPSPASRAPFAAAAMPYANPSVATPSRVAKSETVDGDSARGGCGDSALQPRTGSCFARNRG